jgi:hypothetical protein
MTTPAHPFYERLFMRAAFAWVVIISVPASLNLQTIPAPNGIARLINLTFLTEPRWQAICHTLLVVALAFYIARVLVWLALPIALLIHVAINAVLNSQGAIHHAAQIVSLVLLAQTAAHYYGLWLRRRGADSNVVIEDLAISWSQQVIAAAYFVAGLTKLIETHGAWIFRARFIGVQIFKTAYQAYYNRLDPAGLDAQLAIAQFAAAHGVVVALIAGSGLLLELLAPLMLLGRWWGLVLGCGFLLFHISIDRFMQLSFVFHQLLVLIFIISPIYWIVVAGRSVGRFFRNRAT